MAHCAPIRRQKTGCMNSPSDPLLSVLAEALLSRFLFKLQDARTRLRRAGAGGAPHSPVNSGVTTAPIQAVRASRGKKRAEKELCVTFFFFFFFYRVRFRNIRDKVSFWGVFLFVFFVFWKLRRCQQTSGIRRWVVTIHSDGARSAPLHQNLLTLTKTSPLHVGHKLRQFSVFKCTKCASQICFEENCWSLHTTNTLKFNCR